MIPWFGKSLRTHSGFLYLQIPEEMPKQDFDALGLYDFLQHL
jgi:hypothetical protein